jgi:type IX secretion system PorP/SprF family membrane protein
MNTHHSLAKSLLFRHSTVSSLSAAFAQREVLYEQYVQNPMAINPGFTGVRGDFNMTAMFRGKWFTIQNSPTSQTFAADGTFANGKFGVGFQALNDQTSYFTTTGFSAHLPIILEYPMNGNWGLARRAVSMYCRFRTVAFNGTNRA